MYIVQLPDQTTNETTTLQNVPLPRSHSLSLNSPEPRRRKDVVSYEEVCAKRRLDGHTWLQLKQNLILGLAQLTTAYGGNDIQKICKLTLREAEMFTASETRAWLKQQLMLQEIDDGALPNIEKEILTTLARIPEPSCASAGISVTAILYAATREKNPEKLATRLSKVRELLQYQQLAYYGVSTGCKHISTGRVCALERILWCDTRLTEISETMATGTHNTLPALEELESALVESLTYPALDCGLRSELLIRLGVVLRGKWEAGGDVVAAINTLCECINASDYNTGIAREAYLEIAYITYKLSNSEAAKQSTLEKRACWSAIRSAGLCQTAHNSLPGLEKQKASQHQLSTKDLKKLPQFTGTL
eukprot:sb/3465970/